jgi:hypothetical protein
MAREMQNGHASPFSSQRDYQRFKARRTEGEKLREESADRVSRNASRRAEAYLQSRDDQVKAFLESIKGFSTAIDDARKALRKFSPEARRFAARRLEAVSEKAQDFANDLIRSAEDKPKASGETQHEARP